MRRFTILVGLCALLIAIAVGLTGCHTLRGAGKDITSAGHAIKGAFRKVF
ncbi:MAG: entericidin A/B family lipoprotein [Candidatus Hydrogenedentales bacterium]